MEKFIPNGNHREGSVNKFIIPDEKTKDFVIKNLKAKSASQEKQLNEIEKSPVSEAMIEFIIPELEGFVKQYGAQPVKIDKDYIHYLPKVDTGDDRAAFGGFNIKRQTIHIFKAGVHPYLALAGTIAHEIIHAHSFQSIDDNVDPRRLGLQTLSHSKDKFSFTG